MKTPSPQTTPSPQPPRQPRPSSQPPHAAGRQASFGKRKRGLHALEGLIGGILALYICLLGNIVVYRHPVRFDWTAESLNSISPSTRQVLGLLAEDIYAVIPRYFQPDSNEHVAYREALSLARGTLDEFAVIQPRLRVIEVDVFAEPEKWRDLRARYEIPETQLNRIHIVAGESKDRRQVLTPFDLAVFRGMEAAQVAPPTLAAYRGEKVLIDAIQRVMVRQREPVYFAQDKQELPLSAPRSGDSGGRDESNAGGLSALAYELKTEGYEPRGLALSVAHGVPVDCKLLVIAGPLLPYPQEDLEVIDRYLKGGGRLLFLVGERWTGVEDLVKDWGIEVRPGRVQERIISPVEKTVRRLIVVDAFSASHPITSVFSQVPRFELVLDAPRPLVSAPGGVLRDTEALLTVGSKSAQEEYFYVPDQRTEKPEAGAFNVAMVASQRVPDRPPAGFQRLEARIAVVGKADFVMDKNLLRASHRDFIMNTVAWLVGKESRASVGGQEWSQRSLKLDASIERFLFWVSIFVLPGIFLGLGGFVYVLRRL